MCNDWRSDLRIAVDLMILTVQDGELLLLLSPRAGQPFQGCWSLPGKILPPDQSAESMVYELLGRMLPGQDPYIEQLYTFTALDRDPRARTVSIAYMILMPWSRISDFIEGNDSHLNRFRIQLADNRLELTSKDGIILSSEDLAFDHGSIVIMGVTRLRGKISYTDVGFHFLKDTASFSLGELKMIFQAVLDIPIDSSNFRRSIRNSYAASGMIEPTNYEKPRGRGRPPVLYRLVKQK